MDHRVYLKHEDFFDACESDSLLSKAAQDLENGDARFIGLARCEPTPHAPFHGWKLYFEKAS